MSMSDNSNLAYQTFLSTWNGICAFTAKGMKPICTLFTERTSSGCSSEHKVQYTQASEACLNIKID